MAANDRITNMSAEMECMKHLENKGFLLQFVMFGAQLQCVETGKLYTPDDISIVNFYRFEGISNPDDMSIIYAITTSDGQNGTITDAFGIYANENVGQFFEGVRKIQKQTKRGWKIDYKC
jgi:hypothetical protein